MNHWRANTVKNYFSQPTIASISASICTLCAGNVMGWPLDYNTDFGSKTTQISSDRVRLYVTITFIVSSLFYDKLGKLSKKIILGKSLILLILGWSFVLIPKNQVVGEIATVFFGLSAGFFCSLVPEYIKEVTDKEMRDEKLCFPRIMFALGLLFSNILATQLTNLYVIVGLCYILPIFALILLILIPESPTLYIYKRNDDKALNMLRRLLPEEKAHEELEARQEYIESKVNKTWKESYLSVLKAKWIILILCIIIVLFFVFKKLLFDITDRFSTDFLSAIYTMGGKNVWVQILPTLQMTCTILCCFGIQKMGRRFTNRISGRILFGAIFMFGIWLFKFVDAAKLDNFKYMAFISFIFLNTGLCLRIEPTLFMMLSVNENSINFFGF